MDKGVFEMPSSQRPPEESPPGWDAFTEILKLRSLHDDREDRIKKYGKWTIYACIAVVGLLLMCFISSTIEGCTAWQRHQTALQLEKDVTDLRQRLNVLEADVRTNSSFTMKSMQFIIDINKRRCEKIIQEVTAGSCNAEEDVDLADSVVK